MTKTIICRGCGEPIPPEEMTQNKKYCSAVCRHKASIEQHKRYVDTHPEIVKAQQRRYRLAHPKTQEKIKAKHSVLYSMSSHLHGGVKIQWPDCALPEYISKTLFYSWKKYEIPEGTHLWMDGKQVR